MNEPRAISLGSAADPAPACESHAGCITCSDAAVALTVLRVDAARGLALCEDAGGTRSSVEIALVEPVAGGDVLLVHAGTAIAHDVTEPVPAAPAPAPAKARV